MSRLRSRVAKHLFALILFGWVAYPGFVYQYYFTWPEYYAYPASTTGPHDPHWGFWYW